MAVTRIVNNWNGVTTPSAPNLTGQVGSLITVLDFCLVTTMGWTKPYTGTNLAAYKQPVGTNELFLYVDDTNATNSRFKGFETMTSISTALDPFPTELLLAGGNYLYKSGTADATARSWYFLSDGKIFYFISNATSDTTRNAGFIIFGDYVNTVTYVPNIINVIIAGAVNGTTTSPLIGTISAPSSAYGATSGHFFPRPWNNVGGSIGANKFADPMYMGSSAGESGTGFMPYPSNFYNGIMLSKMYLGEGVQGVRGFLPGLWCLLHNRGTSTPLSQFGTFTGKSGSSISGKTFEFIFTTTTGMIVLETSNTWDTA